MSKIPKSFCLTIIRNKAGVTFIVKKNLFEIDDLELGFFRTKKGTAFCCLTAVPSDDITEFAEKIESVPGVVATAKEPLFISNHQISLKIGKGFPTTEIENAIIRLLDKKFQQSPIIKYKTE